MKKKVLILGCSSDIGIELLNEYKKNNYDVYAHYFKKSNKLNKLKLKKENILQGNFINEVGILNFEKKNLKILKKIDIFINLCGFIERKKIEKLQYLDFIKHFNVNYIASHLLLRHILPNMKKKNWGRICFTSSIGTKFGGSDLGFLYSLSKFLNEFKPRHLVNLSKKNILFNSIKIGATNTLSFRNKFKNKPLELKKRISQIPTKKLIKPINVAKNIFFINSLNNKDISGKIIEISSE